MAVYGIWTLMKAATRNTFSLIVELLSRNPYSIYSFDISYDDIFYLGMRLYWQRSIFP